MRLSQDKLVADIRKTFRGVYLVTGDEPLLMQEACDEIRLAARTAGYLERQVMHAEGSFDWRELSVAAQIRSLFGECKLVELRMAGKPGRAGAAAIEAFLANRDSETALLLTTGALDQGSRNARWVKALDSAGVWVQLWPIEHARMPAWLEARLRRHGLAADREALAALADKVEGNLLAAAQEIERLALVGEAGDQTRLSVEDVLDKVGDSSRFNAISLIDAALSGNSLRTQRLLQGLQSEGVSELQISALLGRELRLLLSGAHELEKGRSLDSVVGSARTWPRKRPLLRQALARHQRSDLEQMHQTLLVLDRQAKGLQPGDPWQSLSSILLRLSGAELPIRDLTGSGPGSGV